MSLMDMLLCFVCDLSNTKTHMIETAKLDLPYLSHFLTDWPQILNMMSLMYWLGVGNIKKP